MNKDVYVLVKGLHSGEAESGDLSTRQMGEYAFRAGKHYVSYIEEDKELGISQKTRVKISDSSVEIRRIGGNGSTMIFENGRTHRTDYYTPYGNFEIEIHTDSYEVTMSEASDLLVAKFHYVIQMNGMKTSECDMTIQISNQPLS